MLSDVQVGVVSFVVYAKTIRTILDADFSDKCVISVTHATRKFN